MAEPNIIHALKAKRDEIARYIRDTEKRLEQARADLAHVAASIRLFETKRDETTEFPAYVRLTGFWRKGELTRLCLEALEKAGVAGR